MRSDRIRLPANEPRCEPSRPCTMRSRCARFQASIPAGTPLTDYTQGSAFADANGGTAACVGFVNLANVHADTPPPRQPKPAVKGLS